MEVLRLVVFQSSGRIKMDKHYDAIVVGSGISGGWAAKELTEKGLNVLVLERGKMIKHVRDYKGEHMPPWKIPYGGMPIDKLYDEEYAVQRNCYAFNETTRHFWNNDKLNPYDAGDSNFEWIRGDVVGGRSLMWGRHSYRLSDLDFNANNVDGYGVDWPIRYQDIAPWYDYVESFIGVSGQPEGLEHFPDGNYLPPMELNIAEKHFRKVLTGNYAERTLTIGRIAVLTKPHNGRGQCHYCGPCERGCSVGAYFSSQSSTLPAAERTGRLTLLSDMVVEKLEYDEHKKRVSAVHVINATTGEKKSFRSKIVFLCASTIATAQILLNSKSDRFPNGLGNDSGQVGRNLMDHTMGVFATGYFDTFQDYTEFGQRPTGIYIPRFRNISNEENLPFVRGYGFQGRTKRDDWRAQLAESGDFGVDFKKHLETPGKWKMTLVGLGECLPDESNRVTLAEKTDRFGIPQAKISFAYQKNEHEMMKDIGQEAEAMLLTAGCKDVAVDIRPPVPGRTIHEMGTARMGNDAGTSVLNGWNQMHSVPNVFITDGSCMSSSSCVNPSLTYMALTARAADFAAKNIKTI